MNSVDAVIPYRFYEAALRAGFAGTDEAGAWVMLRSIEIDSDPWTGESRTRLIVSDVLPLVKRDIASASPTHLTVRTDSFVGILSHAREHSMVPGFLHGHPSGHAKFSIQDDKNERALLKAAQNRNGDQVGLVSLLVLPDGKMRARMWHTQTDVAPLRTVVTGQQLKVFEANSPDAAEIAHLDRQARVFGDDFNISLTQLSAVIVGAGGTGSPLAVMLAKAGIDKIVIVDPDIVEASNLHRLWGATTLDIGRPKAEVLAEYIRSFGSGIEVVAVVGNVLDTSCRDTLKAADIIFCATDDHAGRMLLNRFAYFYETPMIDIGLAVAQANKQRTRDMTGRMTRVHSGTPCLLCRRVVNPTRAREEELKRRAPDMYENQLRDGYVLDGGDPEPAFIAMTTSVATMAVEELAQMIGKFRGTQSKSSQRLRRFQIPEDRVSGGEPDAGCPICHETDYWGKGDMKPFLDRLG